MNDNLHDCLNELYSVCEECAESDWDAYDAFPVSQSTCLVAAAFLRSLPGGPYPSVGAIPSGNISLEWHVASYRTLSVSIDRHGELSYAALIGDERIKGFETFDGECPREIVELIKRVVEENTEHTK